MPYFIRKYFVVIVSASVLIGCDLDPDEFTTHEQLFSAMKREVLSKHMDKLSSVGADVSIFEDVDMDVIGDQPCGKPKRYSNVSGLNKDGKVVSPILLKLFETVRGRCKNCWDQIKIFAEMSASGKIYRVDIYREPSWRNSFREDGTLRKPGDKGEQCGPVENQK